MNDPIIFIFIAVSSICTGFLLGFIIRGFTRRRAKSDEMPETEGQQKELSTPKKAPHRNWTEVANLWRDRRNGSIVFQVEGDYYKRGSDLSTRERELLLKMVMDFYRWLEPPAAMPSKSEEPAQPALSIESKPNELVQAGLPSDSFPNIPVQAEPLSHQKGSLSAVNIITRALRSDVTASNVPTQSMVAQVDIILQEKLIAANMQKWAVRLMELPNNKGMTVLVGLEKYEGIDEVPYERVRAVIRESVSEWERRAENGELVQ